ncbi:ALI_collapsed_G0005790.mRNA.1.CDS.1 [Saccharomyces cerevisiae]|nr:ALI_collapsed_G0005790.mRNA.1.CDS.1 [Saccharomyces cerevisiae]
MVTAITFERYIQWSCSQKGVFSTLSVPRLAKLGFFRYGVRSSLAKFQDLPRREAPVLPELSLVI